VQGNSAKTYYIILEDKVLLSKKPYSDWREVQDGYYKSYKTNLPPLTYSELLEYFEDDFKTKSSWPFSKEQVINFFDSTDMILCSTVSK